MEPVNMQTLFFVQIPISFQNLNFQRTQQALSNNTGNDWDHGIDIILMLSTSTLITSWNSAEFGSLQ